MNGRVTDAQRSSTVRKTRPTRPETPAAVPDRPAWIGLAPAPCRPWPARQSLIRVYEGLVLFYLGSLLYLYPYGIALSADAAVNFRIPDLVAIATLAVGCGTLALRGRGRVDPVLFGVVGMFALFELIAPFVGAVGYRRPLDVVSAVRMAMLWLPMLLLTLLCAPFAAHRFEKRLASLLEVTLWLNLVYGCVQIAVDFGYLPSWLLVTAVLEPWAIGENYNVVLGLRPAGFFVNTTALSVFGAVSLCFYYARYVSDLRRHDLLYTLLSIGVVLITTSRAAYAATVLILFAGWLRLSAGRKITMAAMLTAGIAAMLVLVEQTIGIEQAFYRFQRLADSGLLEDVSFGARIRTIWPEALAAARDYTFGTLIQAPRVLPQIDSGYLNYYLQGKWAFLAALAVLLAGLWWQGLRALAGGRAGRLGLMTLFLAIYLTGAMIISNPLRSPLVIAFVIYALWRLGAERTSAARWAAAGMAGVAVQ